MFSSQNSQVSNDAVFVEDIFSTTLYTGTGASQTQTNNIDLAGKGGLVWLKKRSAAESNYLQDSSSSFANSLVSNTTAAALVSSGIITSVSSTGFTTSSVSSGTTYASWTFRKSPKFFDVVTFTSNGSNAQAISHSLGSVPGCIILKRTDSTQNWIVWHRGDGTTDRYSFSLNNTSGANSSGSIFVSSGYINSTSFQPNRLEDYLGSFPVSGGTYVAYLFAHDAGGFGLTGTDNVISCGSYTGTGSALNVTLGYEPQWVLIKSSTRATDWYLYDTMRGIVTGGNDNYLLANTTAAEAVSGDIEVTATGFQLSPSFNDNYPGDTYIYIAIRRGPMKVPTSGTSVFKPHLETSSAIATISTGFTVDGLIQSRTAGGSSYIPGWQSRLTGKNAVLVSSSTAAENTAVFETFFDLSNAVKIGSLSPTTINYALSRAPSFMDVVCYTGTGVARTVTHNLAAVPELMIVKKRNSATNSSWIAYCDKLLTPITDNAARNFLVLNATQAGTQSDVHWNSTAPTSSVFTVGTSTITNSSADTFVAYLFATCAGVSKVGSYTGNGSSQTINCGFTGGARFVMIKATSTTGNWIVADSARGIVAGNDPALYLNSTAAEVTGLDWIDADNSGFVVNETATIAANTNGVSYIFFAVA